MSDSGDPQTFAEDTVLLDLWLTGNMIWASNAQELYEPVCVYVYARERENERARERKGEGEVVLEHLSSKEDQLEPSPSKGLSISLTW